MRTSSLHPLSQRRVLSVCVLGWWSMGVNACTTSLLAGPHHAPPSRSMNAAKRSAFANDVGTKTNLTLFAPDVPMDIEDGPNPYLFWTTQAVGYTWLERAFIAEGRLPYNADKHSEPLSWGGWPEAPPPGMGRGVAVLHPSFVHWVHRCVEPLGFPTTLTTARDTSADRSVECLLL